MGEFHFIRPLWLLLLPLLAALLWRVWKAGALPSPWQKHCDSLLRTRVVHLLRDAGTLRWAALALGALLGCLALAGPSWERMQARTSHPQDARMIVLDLSLSMLARDAIPSRLELARAKVQQILQYPYAGQFGLVVFAGAGFSVAPLTTDTDTLGAFLPVLEPDVLPLQGSRVDRGLDVAIEVLRKGGAQQGEVIVITDGTDSERAVNLAAELKSLGFRLSVIAVGSPEGAVVPLRGGTVLRDMSGEVVKPPVPIATLQAIAKAGGGLFLEAEQGSNDVEKILDSATLRERTWSASERTVAHWLDRGPWFVLLLLPLGCLIFRRGAYLCAVLGVVVLQPKPAMAWDVFVGADQRALQAIAAGNYTDAVAIARDSQVIGAALYRLGHYDQAALAFADSDSADAHYNRGNALAKGGDLRGAVNAYKATLARAPFHVDARMNRDLIERLLNEERPPEQRWVTGGDPSEAPNAGEQASGSGSRQDGKPIPNAPKPKPNSTPLSDGDLSALDAFAGPTNENETDKVKPVHKDSLTMSDERLDDWIERIPDDPSALLRRRFEYEFNRRRWTPREGRSDSW